MAKQTLAELNKEINRLKWICKNNNIPTAIETMNLTDEIKDAEEIVTKKIATLIEKCEKETGKPYTIYRKEKFSGSHFKVHPTRKRPSSIRCRDIGCKARMSKHCTHRDCDSRK